MTKKDEAGTLHDSGFNCAQSVCAPYAADFRIEKLDALRMSAGFGGGMGRTGGVCGAVTGALMVLGMKHGATTGDPKAKERMYLIARDFMERFEERHGSLQCRVLLDADFSTAEGRASMAERKTHSTVCAGLIADATSILDEMLKKD